ncbi:MAG: hypothetical protein Fues2KO_32560 [Fuerstiella sp.]
MKSYFRCRLGVNRGRSVLPKLRLSRLGIDKSQFEIRCRRSVFQRGANLIELTVDFFAASKNIGVPLSEFSGGSLMGF